MQKLWWHSGHVVKDQWKRCGSEARRLGSERNWAFSSSVVRGISDVEMKDGHTVYGEVRWAGVNHGADCKNW